MRHNPIPLIAVLLLLSTQSFPQKPDHPLSLKTGSFIPQKNITADFIEQYNKRAIKIDGQSFAIIQFEKIPGLEERQQLLNAGVELMDYIPENSYTVSIRANLNATLLRSVKANAIIELDAKQKLLQPLNYGIAPAWSVKIPGTCDVWISFPKTVSYETVIKELQQHNFDITSSFFKNYHVIALRIAPFRLTELATLPFVEFVQPAPPQDQPLNFNSRNGARANVLNASSSNGGYDLHGEGVVVGVGDNADPLQHVDFSGRLIDRNAASGGAHGLHVTGTTAGAGIIEERYAGYAPKATILSQSFSNVFTYASSYVQDYNMVITNNSYGAIVGDCSYSGLYDLYSRILDQQAFDLPNLQNVFAAGNSGFDTCAPYPGGFKTVLGSYQSAKNVITVGNTTSDGTIITASSKGPVKDGRIKPEISAMGTNVWSCWVGFPYVQNTGTSMSSPAVSGGLVLLYQRYRQLHSNADPKNALMKAIICNGTEDKGNTGPDFSYGFGWMNLLRSIDMLNNNHYFNSTINNGGLNTHSISVPANTALLKVMLYWNDPAANVLAAHTLVNDLDLEVVTPSATTLLPAILDTLPANVNNAATTGADHINNIEQIVLNNPAAGNYTVNVKGFAVTQNPPQEYFVVYDVIPVSTTLTWPVGGEDLLPGENVTINWDAYGGPQNNFTVQYSTDNGSTWIDINTNVSSNLRQLAWTVPSVNTDQALVRVSRNGTAMVSTSQPFVILGRPTVSLAGTQCEGYISINWTTVSGATDYEVMMLRGDEMKSVATSNATSYTFSGLSKDTTYWVTVRARINGKNGERATAISRQPNSGTCAGNISDNDLKMDAIVAPQSGRLFTSTALTASTTISARIKNLDDAVVNTFDMKYSVNGGGWVTETVSTPIAAGATYTHNFATTYDFSAIGNYILKVVVKNTAAADPVAVNDTMTIVIKQLNNPAITLSVGPGFLDDIEPATDSTYFSKQIGLDGEDRYDFVSSSTYGRLRTFLNSGIAYSARNAITLDADRPNSGTTDSLTGTFNLSSHNANTDDIRLDFRYKSHDEANNAANKVWIRGDDQQPWIQVYDLYANQNDPGSFKKSSSIELSDLLIANSQNFSTSFQVRWGQWGRGLAADNDGGAGYTFDDIHLYKVVDDIQMISIDTPVVNSCALNSATPVKITVRNSANTTITNIPVKYRVDGGSIVTETISSVAANTSVQYTFTTTANLSSLGTHTVQAWADYSTDSYRENDTAIITLINQPVIGSFPYLENFESGNGSYYTGGKNSTWQYGTPASNKIRSAAGGSKAWKTSLVGNYRDLEFSYLYSPCFNISGMTNPTLSFSLALDLEDCGGSLCDGAWVEYSADGITWTKLGAYGSGTNWYNKNYSGNQLWSISDYTRWHVATTALPAGLTNLRLRWVMNADQGVNKEGIAIDDIHIYDNVYGIYDGATMGSPVTQNVSGNSWVHFLSSGKLVASIHPNNQNMGNTDVQAFINTGAVRHTSNQYYHDRNITIIPANFSLTDSATVRFYFLDNETEALLNATGCASCSKPSSAYELGVSKYTDPSNRSTENGTLTDDLLSGAWSFINSSQTVKVPFDKGYYAEFKVKDFSEFWLNNGGLSGSSPLPVKIISFTAKKQLNKDVLVQWITADESNINRYEVEVARSNSDYQSNSFVKIGEAASRNSTSQQSYNFIDAENNKTGVRYYRLKIIENDGRFYYSAIRPVVFDNTITWRLYPNPSNGLFNFVFQQNAGEQMKLKVYDAAGKMVYQSEITANGFVQKIVIDLHSPKFAKGLYMMVAEGIKKEVFKVLKQ